VHRKIKGVATYIHESAGSAFFFADKRRASGHAAAPAAARLDIIDLTERA
jgi:hypothetical protein